MWQNSPRKGKMEKIDTKYPYKSYMSVAEKLSRADSSMLIQLQSGHFPLWDYLYKQKLEEMDLCKAQTKPIPVEQVAMR